MGLSIELFEACCALIAKTITFASLDPLLNNSCSSSFDYLKRCNFSCDDIRLYYREALQAGIYLLEIGLDESEHFKTNIIGPFADIYGEDEQAISSRVIEVCKQLQNDKIIDELTDELNDESIYQSFDSIGNTNNILTLPDAFLFYLNQLSGYDDSDSALLFLVENSILFKAIDYQFWKLFLQDSRLKAITNINSIKKIKERPNFITEQIQNKQKLLEEAQDRDKEKIEEEILYLQNGLEKIQTFLKDHNKVLPNLEDALSKFDKQLEDDIKEKVTKFTNKNNTNKNSTSTARLRTPGNAVDEVAHLLEHSMELLGKNRIDFSHSLLAGALSDQIEKIEKAKGIFEKIQNTQPEKAVFANNLGVILNAMGFPDKAADYFRRALVLLSSSQRQENFPIESNIFHALLNRGSFDSALKYMLESLESGSEECNLFDIDRYQPEKILGVGGMGVTFLCEDIYEEREVVVKTLWRYESGGIKKIFSEAATVKKINDPRIIKIYDIGRYKINRPYMVTEYCSGIDLQNYMIDKKDGEPLELLEALKITREVAKALTIVHGQQKPIIHRDIKPNNILYTSETNSIKIIDFGIACILPDSELISLSVQQTSGSVIAKNIASTWHYMSPEQQRGDQNITEKSDIFSLGKCLMFLLTGKTPPPENIFALAPYIREQVGELISCCLKSEMEKRYTSQELLINIDKLIKKIEENPIKPSEQETGISYEATIVDDDDSYNDSIQDVSELGAVSTITDDHNENDNFASAMLEVSGEEDEELQIDHGEHAESGDDVEIVSEEETHEEEDEVEVISEEDDEVEVVSEEDSNSEEHISVENQIPQTQKRNLQEVDEIVKKHIEKESSDEEDIEEGMEPLFDSAALDAEQEEEKDKKPKESLKTPTISDIADDSMQPLFDSSSFETEEEANQGIEEEGFQEEPQDQLGDSFIISPEDDDNKESFEEESFEAESFEEEVAPVEEDNLDGITSKSDVLYELEDITVKPAKGPDVVEETEVCLLKIDSPLKDVQLPPDYVWEDDIIICEKDGATMLYVPSGRFIMGYDGEDKTFAETPIHEVYIDGFLIDQCPVTWYQYTIFCEETGRDKPIQPLWDFDEAQPVVNVNWEDANAYAQWAGKTLPSEAQWEKSCKGGLYLDGDDNKMIKNKLPKRRYAWGNDLHDEKHEYCTNFLEESKYGGKSPSPVGIYSQGESPYKCLDMSGNIWEWCQDWYNETYYQNSPDKNPRGSKNGQSRVLRGGAWNSPQEFITSTYRGWLEPEDWWNIVGFRTVKPLLLI